MRTTAPILAVVIAIGIAATVDALLNGGGGAAPEPTTTQRARAAPSPAEERRAAGASGTVYFTLRIDEGCVLHTLKLPSLQDAGSFVLDPCRFDVSSGGDIASGTPCPGRAVEVPSTDTGHFTGCAPAWKPNGDLTFVRDGDVRTPEGDVLIEDVARFALPWFSDPTRVTVRELGWLTNTRLVAVVRGPRTAGGDVILVLQGEKSLSGGDIQAGSSVHVSRSRQEIFVAYPDAGVSVHNREGAFLSQSRFSLPDVGAIVDSPDGRWMAVARPENVCIYELVEPPPREEFPVACLPFDVVDLAWR